MWASKGLGAKENQTPGTFLTQWVAKKITSLE
jgi:hypothetical protein